MLKRILLVLLTLAAVPVLPSGAADPSSGTVSPSVSKLVYSGEAGLGSPLGAGDENGCVEGFNCDTFELTVDVPEGFYARNARTLTATIKWADASNDLNLYLCRGSQSEDPQCLNGAVASSTGDGNVETLSIKDPEPGLYRILTKASTGASSYDGVVTFTPTVSSPGLTFRAAEQLGDFAFDSLALKGGGGEPDMTISPSGKVMLVAGLGPTSPATFYRSTDYGKTFEKLSTTFPMTGGGDWDMYLLDDHTVVGADLALADGIYVHRSTDAGETWTSTRILTDEYDRPWLDHFRDTVYVVAKGVDGIPYLFTSTDGGASFGTPPIPIIVYGLPTQGGPDPVSAFVTNNNAYIDHLVVDQNTGDVYVLYGIDTISSYNANQPVGASNTLYVAHLENGTMVSHPVYLGGADDSFISGFNWMAVDSAGTVYVLVDGRIDGHHSSRLSYSKDHGKTWSKLVDVAPGGAANVYGAIAAASPGTLAMAYIHGTTEDPNEAQPWYAEMARITGADTTTPKTKHVRGLAKPIHLVDICFDGIACGLPGFGNDRNLLDFIWVSVDPKGRAFGVFSSDGPATGGKTNQTPDVLILRQTGNALHEVTKPASKPKVLGKKTTVPGALAGTGLGDEPLILGAALTALAAAMLVRLRRFT